MTASAFRGLKVLSPSITNIAVATKGVVESEAMPIGDSSLLKRKRLYVERMRQLEEGVEFQLLSTAEEISEVDLKRVLR